MYWVYSLLCAALRWVSKACCSQGFLLWSAYIVTTALLSCFLLAHPKFDLLAAVSVSLLCSWLPSFVVAMIFFGLAELLLQLVLYCECRLARWAARESWPCRHIGAKQYIAEGRGLDDS